LERSAFREGNNVARAVNDAHYDDRLGLRLVIDGVRAVEGHAEAGAKLLACPARQREVTQVLKGRFNRDDKA
jgi:hypothetical protein